MKTTPTFTIRNASGMSLTASALGGIVTSLRAPDAKGRPGEVLLACARPEQHHANGYMNAIIGRYGNRISRGGFALDGEFRALAQNSGGRKHPCSLHGGEKGFDRKVWQVRKFEAADGPALEFTTLSPDGDENYPGNLFVRVVYTLTRDNAWRIDYLATTDRPTVVNLTQHAYFNLNGGARDVAEHLVQVNASRFTEVDAALLPTGRVPPVAGTALDLRDPVRLGDRFALAAKDRLLKGVRRAGARWRSGRPSPACRSTPRTSSSPPRPRGAARSTGGTGASASRRSTRPTPRTSRRSRPSASTRARSTAARPSTPSARSTRTRTAARAAATTGSARGPARAWPPGRRPLPKTMVADALRAATESSVPP